MLPALGTCHHTYHRDESLSLLNLAQGCPSLQYRGLSVLLTSIDTAALFAPYIEYSSLKSLTSYLPKWLVPMVEATIHGNVPCDEIEYGVSDHQISWQDFYCETCDGWVSQPLQPEHWDLICGDCNRHADECDCCQQCHNTASNCECCGTCGEAPGWCYCCEHCGETQDDCCCDHCRGCDQKTYECTCSSGSSSGSYHSFGVSNKIPWDARADEPLDLHLPKMSKCQHKSIDPVQTAADFYLLDAIKNLVRISEIDGLSDAQSARLNERRYVQQDTMISAVTLSASRAYNSLVERVAPSFLAYSISAVGGELRYHKAVSGVALPTTRSSAWDAFVDIVQVKGPKVLFEADTLFREFSSNSYGGPKWGAASKVVGQYLNGTMPAWLFVDRVFTLQHNGGCFLNKVEWARTNRLGWGLSSMITLLNAHAADQTDWDTLLQCASPDVRVMFSLAEKALTRIARRHGGSLRPITRRKLSHH